MNYLKFTPYIYLAIAIFCIYEGITQLSDPDGSYWLSFIIAALGLFMFFFRMHFAKKFENRNRKP